MLDVYWLEQAEAVLPAHDDFLSAAERAFLNRLHVPKRRADWRFGRWTAKRAVAAYLNATGDPGALAAIEIRPAPSGAPEAFIDGMPAPATISISHRGGIAACAVARSGAELGCDLELVEQREDAFLADYFTADEQARVARASSCERDSLVTLLWSAKESVLKALREGLRLDTTCVSVTPGDALGFDNTWRSFCARCPGVRTFDGWWQSSGGMFRTLAASPSPAVPVRLRAGFPGKLRAIHPSAQPAGV